MQFLKLFSLENADIKSDTYMDGDDGDEGGASSKGGAVGESVVLQVRLTCLSVYLFICLFSVLVCNSLCLFDVLSVCLSTHPH